MLSRVITVIVIQKKTIWESPLRFIFIVYSHCSWCRFKMKFGFRGRCCLKHTMLHIFTFYIKCPNIHPDNDSLHAASVLVIHGRRDVVDVESLLRNWFNKASSSSIVTISKKLFRITQTQMHQFQSQTWNWYVFVRVPVWSRFTMVSSCLIKSKHVSILITYFLLHLFNLEVWKWRHSSDFSGYFWLKFSSNIYIPCTATCSL